MSPLHIVSACLCGVAGFVLCSRLRSGTATTGTQYQSKALTSCVVGGISMRGGEGNIYNLLVGVFVIGVLSNGLTIIGVNDYWQSVAQGIILAFAVGTDYYSRTHVKTTPVPQNRNSTAAGVWVLPERPRLTLILAAERSTLWRIF